ncbi:transketolase C-terminal domain-containing protein [Anaerobacillus sp. CMMVII]|uniref:transketolase C-terminal domain-containing protein n=1 Tax=Anaerobacillus sp. CMMVII TaxID=2755588 RepID=UPI0021B7508E|nr:transketolase C-terminal domain-containing protein [Anaerobacillus sp. CMMVII]
MQLNDINLENHNYTLQKKYEEIKQNEARFDTYRTEDAEYFVVAYGTVSRICKNVIDAARKQGIKVGMIRPITLWPFPEQPFVEYRELAKSFLTVEMNTGQMVEDVRLAVNGRAPVSFFGRTGGVIPSQSEILEAIINLAGGEQ